MNGHSNPIQTPERESGQDRWTDFLPSFALCPHSLPSMAAAVAVVHMNMPLRRRGQGKAVELSECTVLLYKPWFCVTRVHLQLPVTSIAMRCEKMTKWIDLSHYVWACQQAFSRSQGVPPSPRSFRLFLRIESWRRRYIKVAVAVAYWQQRCPSLRP